MFKSQNFRARRPAAHLVQPALLGEEAEAKQRENGLSKITQDGSWAPVIRIPTVALHDTLSTEQYSQVFPGFYLI